MDITESSAHVPGSACLTRGWFMGCMDEMDAILYQNDEGSFLHVHVMKRELKYLDLLNYI